MNESNPQPAATELTTFRIKLTFTVEVDATSEEEADEMARFEVLKQLLSEEFFDSLSTDPDESTAQDVE